MREQRSVCACSWIGFAGLVGARMSVVVCLRNGGLLRAWKAFLAPLSTALLSLTILLPCLSQHPPLSLCISLSMPL